MTLEYSEEEIELNFAILASVLETQTQDSLTESKLTNGQIRQIKKHMKTYKRLLKRIRASDLVIDTIFFTNELHFCF